MNATHPAMTTPPLCAASEPRTRSYGPHELLHDAARLVPRLAALGAIVLRRRLDPHVREEVAIAVSKANRCRYCTFSHREILLSSGADLHALGEFEQIERLDERVYAAVIWAQARAESGFGAVPEVFERELAARFSERERRDIDTVARAMHMISSCGHTADGLVKRLRGHTAPRSRLRDELVMAALYFPFAVPVYLYLGVRRGSLREFLRDFATFSKAFESNTPSSGSSMPLPETSRPDEQREAQHVEPN